MPPRKKRVANHRPEPILYKAGMEVAEAFGPIGEAFKAIVESHKWEKFRVKPEHDGNVNMTLEFL